MTWKYTDYEDVLDSNSIHQMWYNRNTRELATEYMHGATIYGWKNVPLSLWDDLVQASRDPHLSVGALHAHKVKGKFDGFLPDYSDDGFIFEPPLRVIGVTAETEDLKQWQADDLDFTISGFRPFEVTVKAKSLDEALDKVTSGESGLMIRSATVTFDV